MNAAPSAKVPLPWLIQTIATPGAVPTRSGLPSPLKSATVNCSTDPAPNGEPEAFVYSGAPMTAVPTGRNRTLEVGSPGLVTVTDSVPAALIRPAGTTPLSVPPETDVARAVPFRSITEAALKLAPSRF